MNDKNDINNDIKEINKLNIPLDEKNKRIQELYMKKFKNINNDDINNINNNDCVHYKNNCLLKCNICLDFYSCRLCHDEINTSHKFDRFSVEEIKCIMCNKEQKKSNKCIECNIKFGKYYCSICSIYENENTDIFHCVDCGICRRGKREDYRHCKLCNSCISNYGEHKCIENVSNSNCPICLENLFYSTKEVSVIKCGHYIHKDCFIEYSKKNYKCPVCLKSICDMKEYWKEIRNHINLNPIPDEYKREVDILCYDCEKISKSDFHFDFIECTLCNGYNTTVK